MMSVLSSFDTIRSSLLGSRRSTVLSAHELRALKAVQGGDGRAFSMYGHTVDQFERRGFRLVGRTALEAIDDHDCRLIGDALQNWLVKPLAYVCDPFCGSANLLVALADRFRATAVGIEADESVHEATQHSLRLLNHRDISLTLRSNGPFVPASVDSEDVYILDPPWGPALANGSLNLAKTSPSVIDIIDRISHCRKGRPYIAVLKMNDNVTIESWQPILFRCKHVKLVAHPCNLEPGMNTVYALLSV